MATNVVLPFSRSASSSESQKFTPKGFNGSRTLKMAGPGITTTAGRGSAAAVKAATGPQGSVVKRGGGGKEMDASRDSSDKRSSAKNIDPASYRHSIFHMTCTAMLEQGFHKSFEELFSLVEGQRREHERAGPAAVLLEPLVEHDLAKLELLSSQLTQAEDAQRSGDLDTVYMCQQTLAQRFEQSKDTWLSDHFYQRSLETGSLVKSDNRRKEGEAHCHVGLALENRGDLAKASAHMVTFYELARKHKWHTEGGDSLHEIACEHLRRVYTKIAEEVHAQNAESAIATLKKALEMAKEGGDSYQEGLSCYRLGNAFEGVRDHDTAIHYHKSFLERCKYHNDAAGIGNAYEALSKCYESKGDTENAVRCLELYVEVAEQAMLHDSLAKACSAIGIMHNTLGDYDKAVEYFHRCYDLCRQLGDKEALHAARVQYGIAQGHQLMRSFSSALTDPTSSSLQELVVWKDNREALAEEARGSDGGVDGDVGGEAEAGVEEGEEGSGGGVEGEDSGEQRHVGFKETGLAGDTGDVQPDRTDDSDV